MLRFRTFTKLKESFSPEFFTIPGVGVGKLDKNGEAYTHTKYHDLTPEKIHHHLDKTRDSIRKHRDSGGRIATRRGDELTSRYEHLKDAAKRKDCWHGYCEKRKTDKSSDAADIYGS